ncbi:hypothetical protein [Chelativorans sp. AA-79]|uniref:hypothetical protein n=1 Tax=Chelativorans sp. AA-79 TaxID=3028735 RepID=UPI0023F7F819|nr:hypothetical protein [Chelativorans sp. AA-79]WEX10656.1 hypothetical protein PVE73_06830 [Chelativorans sp. AA-79]
MKAKTRFIALMAGALLPALAATGASSQALDLSGERVTMIVPYGEGGGSTIHARLLTPALEKALPGEPTILIRNIDGGGSVRGINEFHKIAKPDGRTIASIGTGTFFQYLLEDPAVAYPLPEFKPFLTSPFGLLVYARKDQGLGDDPIENVKTLRELQPVYGGANATSSDLPALLSIDLLGIKPNYVFGLSNAESRSGFERGEFTLNYDNMASWAEAVKPMVDEGTAVPLFTFGFETENGEIVRDPMLPEIPTFLEVYKAVHGEPLTGPAYDVWKALFNIRVMGSKMFVLPVGTPQEIVDVYSDAMKQALASEALQSDQAKLVLGDYPQSTGKASQVIFEGATKFGAEQRQWLKNWLKETHQVQ